MDFKMRCSMSHDCCWIVFWQDHRGRYHASVTDEGKIQAGFRRPYPTIYLNPLDPKLPRRAPGWFDTKYLNADAKANQKLAAQVIAFAMNPDNQQRALDEYEREKREKEAQWYAQAQQNNFERLREALVFFKVNPEGFSDTDLLDACKQGIALANLKVKA